MRLFQWLLSRSASCRFARAHHKLRYGEKEPAFAGKADLFIEPVVGSLGVDMLVSDRILPQQVHHGDRVAIWLALSEQNWLRRAGQPLNVTG